MMITRLYSSLNVSRLNTVGADIGKRSDASIATWFRIDVSKLDIDTKLI